MKLDERIIGFFDWIYEMGILKYIFWLALFSLTDGRILIGAFIWYLIKFKLINVRKEG